MTNKIKLIIQLFMLVLLVASCSSSYRRNNYGESESARNDYNKKEHKKIYDKAVSFYNYGIYDSAKILCNELLKTFYADEAIDLRNKIDSVEFQSTWQDIIRLSDENNIPELYDILLKSQSQALKTHKKEFDSIVYTKSVDLLNTGNYLEFETYFFLLTKDAVYFDIITSSDSYKYFANNIDEIKKLKREEKKKKQEEEKQQKQIKELEYAYPLFVEADALITYYQNKLSGRTYKRILEYLYDEDFSRSYTSKGQEFRKAYRFENGYFDLEIDIWFSYGYERVFYEVTVPVINFKDANGKNRTYYVESERLY